MATVNLTIEQKIAFETAERKLMRELLKPSENEKDYVAYTIPFNGKIPNKVIRGPTYVFDTHVPSGLPWLRLATDEEIKDIRGKQRDRRFRTRLDHWMGRDD